MLYGVDFRPPFGDRERPAAPPRNRKNYTTAAALADNSAPIAGHSERPTPSAPFLYHGGGATQNRQVLRNERCGQSLCVGRTSGRLGGQPTQPDCQDRTRCTPAIRLHERV